MFQKQTFRSTKSGFGGFGRRQATGTAVVKYNSVAGTDVVEEGGTTTDVYVNIHCITSMEEYESKSLEELRLEDYVAKRKGPSGVFGTNTNTSTTGGRFGSTSSPTRLFGYEKEIPYQNLYIFGFPRPTGTAVWTYLPVCSRYLQGYFGSAKHDISMTTHCITTMKEYESKSLEELRLEDYVSGRKGPTGVFGTNLPVFGPPATTSAPSLDGSSISSTPALRQTNTFPCGDGKLAKKQTMGLFGANKPAFGATPTPGTGLFAATTTQAPAFGTNTSTFGFGANTQNQTGGLFNNKPATSGFGTTPSTGFGGFGAGLFAKTNTTAPTFGTTTPAFGTTGFGTNTTGSNLFGNNTFGKPPTSQPSFGFNTQPALDKNNRLESELHESEKKLNKLQTKSEKLIRKSQQLKKRQRIDSKVLQKCKSEISQVQKHVKILTHQNALEPCEQLGLQQGKEDALREQGAGNRDTAEDLQQGEEDSLREQGTGNRNTAEDLQQGEEDALREQGAGNENTAEDLQQGEEVALREQGVGNENTAEDLQQGEEDALREQGAGNGNTAEDLQQGGKDALREQGAGNGNTAEDPQQGEEDALWKQGAGNGNTAEDLQQGEEDTLQELGTGNGNTAEDLQQGEGYSLREQGVGNGNTAEDLQQGEKDALREQGAGNGNTAEDLQQGEEDSLREQGAGNGNTAEDLQQGEEDALREQGAGNGNTAEDLQQGEEYSLREQGVGNGNTAEDLQQGEKDALREQGAGNGNTAEDLQQGEEDSLREQGAGNGNTEEDQVQIKKVEKPEDTDIMLWKKKIKLAEEDAQKALERAEKAEKKLEELQQRHSIVAEDRKINYFKNREEKVKIEPAPLQEPTPTSRPPSPPVLPPPPVPPPPAVFQSSPTEDMAAKLANKRASLKKTKQNGRGAIDAIVDQMKGLKFQLKSTDQNILEKPKNDQPVAVKNMIQIVVTLTDKKNIKKLATEQEE